MKTKLIMILSGAILFVGCQTVPYKPYARNVKMSPKLGGIVALNLQHNEEDRLKAHQMMSGNCKGSDFDILEEGEVVIGTETNSTETRDQGAAGSKVGSLWGIPINSGGRDPSTNTSSSTTQKKEWQIKYECAIASGKKSSNKRIQ